MKRILLFGVLLLVFGLSSCQCSNQPDVGPVENEEASAHLPVQGEDLPPSYL